MVFWEYKAAHYKMWNWLAEHPGADKDAWPGWEKARMFESLFRGHWISNSCFMCDYFETKCWRCPLCQKFGHPCIEYVGGIFRYWVYATRNGKKSKARRLAIMIRDAWR